MGRISEFVEKLVLSHEMGESEFSLQKRVTNKAIEVFERIGQMCSFGPEGIFLAEELLAVTAIGMIYTSFIGANLLLTPAIVTTYVVAKVAGSLLIEEITGKKLCNEML